MKMGEEGWTMVGLLATPLLQRSGARTRLRLAHKAAGQFVCGGGRRARIQG